MSAPTPLMAAAVYRAPGEITVERLPVPDPGPGQVLVEVSHCGICGTDIHMMLEGWGQPGSVFGHEYSGRVAVCGEGVSGWEPGQAVVGTPERPCGSCSECRSGRPSLCLRRPTPGIEVARGAFARYVVVSESQLLAIPEGLSLREAALAEPLAVALHAIGRAPINDRSRVLVSGAGPIGALILAALSARGVEGVVVVEPNPLRADLAHRLGAEQVLSPQDLDVPSGLEPGRLVEHPADVVFECSGKAAAVEAGIAQLGKRGLLVVVGTGLEPPALDLNRLLLSELTLTGAFEYDADGFARALELLAAGTLDTAELLEPDDIPLGGLAGALERLGGGQVAGKLMVAPAMEDE